MDGLIFRVDDVSPNTDLYDLNLCAEILHDVLGAEIWYCVNIFGRSGNEAVYPDLPLRDRPFKYFLDVDRLHGTNLEVPPFVKITSHGLIHGEHGKMAPGQQEMSIVLSCNLLKTNIFIPPFISYDHHTEKICKQNNITMIDGKGWKSAESELYDPSHKLWFFHHWRFNTNHLKGWLSASEIHV